MINMIFGTSSNIFAFFKNWFDFILLRNVDLNSEKSSSKNFLANQLLGFSQFFALSDLIGQDLDH